MSDRSPGLPWLAPDLLSSHGDAWGALALLLVLPGAKVLSHLHLRPPALVFLNGTVIKRQASALSQWSLARLRSRKKADSQYDGYSDGKEPLEASTQPPVQGTAIASAASGCFCPLKAFKVLGTSHTEIPNPWWPIPGRHLPFAKEIVFTSSVKPLSATWGFCPLHHRSNRGAVRYARQGGNWLGSHHHPQAMLNTQNY